MSVMVCFILFFQLCIVACLPLILLLKLNELSWRLACFKITPVRLVSMRRPDTNKNSMFQHL